MEFKKLVPIGSTVSIKKHKINKGISKDLYDKLPKLLHGKIIDYKMTDGMGIGYVLMTEKNLKIWIFENELDNKTREVYNIDKSNKFAISNKDTLSFAINKIDYELNGSKSIKAIANPLNLINWLIYTLKDIF